MLTAVLNPFAPAQSLGSQSRRSPQMLSPHSPLTEADLAKVTYLNLRFTQITDAGLKDVAKLQKLTFCLLSSVRLA